MKDILLKYAIGLQNSDQSRESQEIYFFLQKFPGKIKRTADKLLSGMNKNGSMQPIKKIVESRTFDEINTRLEKRLALGNRLESLLNFLGKKFTFGAMMRDVADSVLD